jgi:hypothetical protein
VGNRKRRDPGPQQHGEGQHGEKTHRHLIEQLQAGESRTQAGVEPEIEGRRRLQEDRQQHDEAEKASERARE